MREQAQVVGVEVWSCVAGGAVGQLDELAPADVAFPAQPPCRVLAVVGEMRERDVVPIVVGFQLAVDLAQVTRIGVGQCPLKNQVGRANPR